MRRYSERFRQAVQVAKVPESYAKMLLAQSLNKDTRLYLNMEINRLVSQAPGVPAKSLLTMTAEQKWDRVTFD